MSDFFGGGLRTSLTLSGKGKPPTVKISHISTTMKPARNICISLERLQFLSLAPNVFDASYLRPTAACFVSDRHSKKTVMTIAMAHSIIEPDLVSFLPAASRNMFAYPDSPSTLHCLKVCQLTRILQIPIDCSWARRSITPSMPPQHNRENLTYGTYIANGQGTVLAESLSETENDQHSCFSALY